MEDSWTVNDRVEINVNGAPAVGTIRFVGGTAFASGKWVGIELDLPNGKNDGSVQGTKYFEAKPLHGVFVRATQVKPTASKVWRIRVGSC